MLTSSLHSDSGKATRPTSKARRLRVIPSPSSYRWKVLDTTNAPAGRLLGKQTTQQPQRGRQGSGNHRCGLNPYMNPEKIRTASKQPILEPRAHLPQPRASSSFLEVLPVHFNPPQDVSGFPGLQILSRWRILGTWSKIVIAFFLRYGLLESCLFRFDSFCCSSKPLTGLHTHVLFFLYS